jgi:MOSC domain-containing protein YiiM
MADGNIVIYFKVITSGQIYSQTDLKSVIHMAPELTLATVFHFF